MENDLLKVLQEIRGYAFLIMIFIGIWAISSTIKVIFEIYKIIKGTPSENDFNTIAGKLFDNTEYPELIQKCNDALRSNSRDHLATWWLAKAHYASEEYLQSKELFRKLSQLVPEWRKESIEPYLVAIDELETANKTLNQDAP